MVHPTWLPQIDCPYKELFNRLAKENVPHKVISNISPNDLKPLQQYVNKDSVQFFNSKIQNREAIDPIIISADDEILDGHHRAAAFKLHPNINVFCLKIYLSKEDASRVLNKVQDKYDFENELSSSKEEEINEDVSDNNSKTLKLYSSFKLNEKKMSFLQLEKNENHIHEYEVTFDNLYEVGEDEYQNCLKEKKDVFEMLAEKWKQTESNLKEDANKYALPYEAYIKKTIYKEAKNKGYDGIKYGNKFVQTIP